MQRWVIALKLGPDALRGWRTTTPMRSTGHRCRFSASSRWVGEQLVVSWRKGSCPGMRRVCDVG